MLKLIKFLYKHMLEVVAWIIVIGCGFIGFGIGDSLSSRNSDYTGIGFIIGIVVGFIINVFGLGLLSTIVEMAEDIKDIKSHTIQGTSKNQPHSRSSKCPKCNSYIKNDDIFCQHCGEKL